MKKSLLIFTIISLFSLNSFSQNFKLEDQGGANITNSEITVDVTADDLSDVYTEIIYFVKFLNLTDSSKSINVRRTIVSEVSGSENFFCWALCHPSTVNLSTALIIPNQTTNEAFSSHYKPKQNLGTTLVNYVFFDVNNPSDSVFLKINYTTASLGIANKNNTKAIGLSFYPNPTNNSLTISLNSSSTSNKEIKITNILGSVVKSQNLGKLENTVTIKTEDLEDGVYFVSVMSNGKIENSKRLVVKH